MKLGTPVPDYKAFKRYIVITVVTLTLLLLSFSGWKSFTEYRLKVGAAEQQSRGYARALKEHAERSISEADSLLLDTIDELRSHGGIDRENNRQLRGFLDRHPRNMPQVSHVVLVNRDGLLHSHSLRIPVKQANVADREYFLHHRNHPEDNEPFLSKPVKSRINGKWLFTLSRPVISASGTFDGLVAVAFEIEYFRSFYSSLDLGKKGRILLVRKDGTLILAQPFNEKDFSSDFTKSALIRTHLLHAPKGTYQITQGKALLENDTRLVAYESLNTYPIIALTNMSLDEVLDSWRTGTILQTALTLFACAGLYLLMIILLRQIKRVQTAYRRQSEQQAEIASAAAAWQTTFDSVADAIWVLDLDQNILRCNRATGTIFGVDSDQAAGRLCCDVAHKCHSPLAACPFRKMLESGQRADMQIAIGERWFEVSVDPVRDSIGTITGAVHIVSDITDLKQAEEEYRTLVDNLPVVIWQTDEQGAVHYISPAVTQVDGYTVEEVYAGGVEHLLSRIHPDDRETVRSAFKALFTDGAVFDVEFRLQHKDGRWIWLHDFAYATILLDGIRVAHGVFSDVSARKLAEDERDQLEMQLRQAQKMEAIGHLAGGIAHDFNNLLTPIMGYAEMTAAAIPDGSPLAPKLTGIITAAHKAKALTQQLLSFGRRQSIVTEVVDLNEVILSFNTILRRTIRESIRIDLVLDPEGSFIKGDRTQIEQIILNMAVNAQDAFDGSHGRINIETCKIVMDGENARIHPGMVPGEYVLASFRDNGCGMRAEVINHIFEPFFTTKQVGHGTGLGLATVYGIVKQHGAHISVTSHEGEGTTFNVYFPICAQVPLIQPQPVPVPGRKHAGEITVLVVEDNDMVREMVQEMLTGFGYTVLAAADPHQAIELLAESAGQFDLLVSDIVMPGMNGPELYEQLVVQIPSLKVVYISGYPINPTLRGGTLEDDVNYLQKPFTAEALLERIHQVM